MSHEYERVLTPASGLRLHLNENTSGCSPAVMEVLQTLTRKDVATYPDYDAAIAACAARLGVASDSLLLTNGLDEGILAASVAALRPRRHCVATIDRDSIPENRHLGIRFGLHSDLLLPTRDRNYIRPGQSLDR